MKAAVFHHPKKITCDDVPDPRIQDPRDAILRVTATAICGSDLHIYNGLFPQLRPMVLGHEFMGIVEEVGSQVKNLKKGDRVVVPFPIACGECFFCTRGQTPHCEKSNPRHYGPSGGMLDGKGGALFGYTDLYGGYDGGQAEFVRVPYADVGPRKVPEGLSDEAVLFLSDIFPTGYTAIDWANLQGGETVAIWGGGPVGLMAAKSAWLRKAGRVIVLDRERYRLDRARTVANAEVVDIGDGDPVETLRAMTDGRGLDVCVDAVGLEAHHSTLEKLGNLLHLPQRGSLHAFQGCLDAVRRGGTVSVVGVYATPYDGFPFGQIFDKGLRVVTGQCPVHRYIDDLLQHVVTGKVRLDDVITHRLPLAQVGEGYEMFSKKRDDCVKVVLTP